MNQQDILEKLPERIRDKIIITERREFWAVSHPFVDDETLFALTRTAIEDLGGKYGGYHTKAAHYEIPKTPQTEGVTPLSVSMDKSKPPKLEPPQIEEVGVKLVNVDKLVQSPWWPRQLNVENEEFKELVQSIRKYGVQGNLLARLKDGRLELVFGHRRLFAARKAGLKSVPVKIRDLTDEEALQIQFEENDKQKHWSAMETAHYLLTMMEKLGCQTQKELAEKIGKTESWISRHMAVLTLEDMSESAHKIAPGQFPIDEEHLSVPIETGKLTERQARELLKAPEEKREEILQKAQEDGKIPSARTIRDLAQLHPCNVSGCLSRTDVKEWNGRGIWLCPKHMKDAEMNPAKFLGLKRTKEVTEQIKVVKPPKVEDTWEQRKAVMQPQKSKFELAVIQDLQGEGVAIQTDREFCLLKTKPDGYNAKKNVAIYIDGPPHEGKEEQDDRIRGLLTKRHGCHVLPVKFAHDNMKERETAKQKIREFLEGL